MPQVKLRALYCQRCGLSHIVRLKAKPTACDSCYGRYFHHQHPASRIPEWKQKYSRFDLKFLHDLEIGAAV